jgi:hypothetical protein
MLRAIRGQDLLKAPRAPDRTDPAVASVLGKALEDEQAFEQKLQASTTVACPSGDPNGDTYRVTL